MRGSIGSARGGPGGGRRVPGPPRDRVKARLLRLYLALTWRFGPQAWWPGRTAYEIAAGAVLTQHTAGTNAARAVAALRARRRLTARRLAGLPAGKPPAGVPPAGPPPAEGPAAPPPCPVP